MSYAGYQEKKKELESKGEYNEYDCGHGYSFDSLDDEFAYRKFEEDWNPVYRVVVTISDPLPVEIVKVKTKKVSPFIESSFSNLEDPSIYYYDRLAASKAIVQEVMAELGIEDCGNVDYGQTAKNKKWGNANHSGIQFVTAFGGYPFNKDWDFTGRRFMRGSLEDMVVKYNSDKEEISKILKSKYAACFGDFDESKVLAFAKNFKNEVEWIHGKVKDMDVKQKSYEEKLFLMKKIRELINEFDRVLVDK